MSPSVTLQTHVVLAVDCVHLFFSLFFSEERSDEKLGQSVESALKSLCRAVEVVVGVGKTGVGVVHTTFVLNVLGVFFLVGVLLSALEEHVLQEVSSAVQFDGVFAIESAANSYVERSRTLVSFGVADE